MLIKQQKNILIPIPSYGFDPTEVSIPWKLLTANDFEVTFATPQGDKASGDNIMLTGDSLGIWRTILKARKDVVEAYYEMEGSDAFCNPFKYTDIKEEDYDGIILPGGHDKGVIEYLESNLLQKLIVNFFSVKKPVGAICHGVVLLARSINPATNKSVIYNYKTTGLLKSQELLAYNLTKLWLKDYYLTYPNKTVEDEVKSVLIKEDNFIKGKTPLGRDSEKHLEKGFYVKDRHYISARWPGDIYNFSIEFIKMMTNIVVINEDHAGKCI